MSQLEVCLSKDPDFTLNSQYHRFSKLMRGSFSDIFTAQSLKDGSLVIVKAPKKSAHSLIEISKEAIFLLKLQSFNFVPKVLYLQANEECEALVLEKLGDSLEQLKRNYNNFSLKTTVIIAIQMLNILEKMHSLGILHRDIKPSNILTGTQDRNSQLFLIDFDIATSSSNQFTCTASNQGEIFIGTKIFASRKAHRGGCFSRKDDLESLLLTLIYLYQGKLPWCQSNCGILALGDLKNKFLKGKFFEGLPKEFGCFFEYLEKIDDEMIPDYEYIRELFKSMAARFDIDFKDFCCEWDKKKKMSDESADASEISQQLSNSENEVEIQDDEEEISIEKKMLGFNKLISQNAGKFMSYTKKNSTYMKDFKNIFLKCQNEGKP